MKAVNYLHILPHRSGLCPAKALHFSFLPQLCLVGIDLRWYVLYWLKQKFQNPVMVCAGNTLFLQALREVWKCGRNPAARCKWLQSCFQS